MPKRGDDVGALAVRALLCIVVSVQLKFHDDGPFLLVTKTSFDDLSRRLVERDVTQHVTLEHFRPTITVSGNSPPFDEVRSADRLLNFLPNANFVYGS